MKGKTQQAPVVPLFGRDEMNLVEIPIGPITKTNSSTLEVDHEVFDHRAKRFVNRRLVVTGSEKYGLPKPVDDQVLIGLKALTYEAGFKRPEVWFSRYHLCRTLGWEPDGRAYNRIEDSLDRLMSTNLKFKDAWWDKGEKEWRTCAFHLIESYELCSSDRMNRIRTKTKNTHQALCNFVWNGVVWKSFSDGNIRKLDMEMYRRIANGRRRDVAIRLYRILDKHFYKKGVQSWDVRRLAVGTLGLNAKFVSKMIPVLERAGRVLVDSAFLETFRFRDGKSGHVEVVFAKKRPKSVAVRKSSRGASIDKTDTQSEISSEWLSSFSADELEQAETDAINSEFGSSFERSSAAKERAAGKSIRESGFVRQGFVKRYLESKSKPATSAA